MASAVERIAQLENANRTGSLDPFGGVLAAHDSEVLARLLELRQKMSAAGGGGGGGGGAAASEENQALRAENAQLKKEVAKQAYRIAHLVKMLNAEEAKAIK